MAKKTRFKSSILVHVKGRSRGSDGHFTKMEMEVLRQVANSVMFFKDRYKNLDISVDMFRV